MNELYTAEELRRVMEDARESIAAWEEIQEAFRKLNLACYKEAERGGSYLVQVYFHDSFKNTTIDYAIPKIIQMAKDWGFNVAQIATTIIALSWDGEKIDYAKVSASLK